MNLLSSMWKVGKPAVGSMWKALSIIWGSRSSAAVLLASPLNFPSNINKNIQTSDRKWNIIYIGGPSLHGAIAKGWGHTMGAWPTSSNAFPQVSTVDYALLGGGTPRFPAVFPRPQKGQMSRPATGIGQELAKTPGTVQDPCQAPRIL